MKVTIFQPVSHFQDQTYNGFTLIEVVLALLLVSMLGLSITSYMRHSTNTLSNADTESDLLKSTQTLQKLLTDDLRQAAAVNPSCDANQLSAAATTVCSDIAIPGSIIPLPGLTYNDVDALSTLGATADLATATNSLSSLSDGIRIIQYDFSTTFNCRLNGFRANNPSIEAGAAAGAERLWPLREGCNGNLAVGELYVVMEHDATSSAVFSNVFQITALSDLGGNETSVDQLQVDAASADNLYNQVGGLGLSGFSSSARIFPIKFIEWAHDPAQNILYRREIDPSASDLTGKQAWKPIATNIESFQIYPLTITTSGPVEHQRSMQFTSDTANDGLEDIRGVSPRFVLKSTRAVKDGTTYDNPVTPTVEADSYPRKELKFYVDIRNTETGT